MAGLSFFVVDGSASQCENLACPKGSNPQLFQMSKITLTPYVSRRLLVLARQMRDAQKLYSATQSNHDLTLAKRQEALFDRLLALIADDDSDVFLTPEPGPEIDVL